MRRLPVLFLISGMLVLLPISARAESTTDLTVTVGTDQTVYDLGTAVTFTLTVTNPTATPVTITFPTTQRYDFAVTSTVTGKEVWRWSEARSFASSLTSQVIQAHGTATFTERWDQSSRARQQVPAGVYRIDASLHADPPLSAVPATFTLSELHQANLRLSLQTTRTTYAPGTVVAATLRITNPTSAPVTLTFPTGQQYDFVVTDPARGTIWRWSAGRYFAPGATTRTLAPSQTLIFTEQWDQRDQSGRPVPSGTYVLNAWVTADTPLYAPPVSITIAFPQPTVQTTTDRTSYIAGAHVMLAFTVTNPSDAPLALDFPTDQDFDVSIVSMATGAEVWRWSWGRAFLPSATTHTIPARGAFRFMAEWDQRGADGRQVPDGVYVITGRLVTVTPLDAEPVTIAIRTISEQIALYNGCNNVTLTWPDGTSPITVAVAITPVSALVGIWRYDATTHAFQGFTPQAPQVSDLVSVDRLDAVFICLRGAGALARPIVADPNHDGDVASAAGNTFGVSSP